VFCPKYRKPVLVGEVAKVVEEQMRLACTERGWLLHSLSIQPDHVHIFITARPYFSPMFLVKVLKGVSAIHAMKVWKFAKRFWSPSYYVGTAGTVSEETIKKYIAEQETRASPLHQ
jgi:putative transposase